MNDLDIVLEALGANPPKAKAAELHQKLRALRRQGLEPTVLECSTPSCRTKVRAMGQKCPACLRRLYG